MDCLPIFTELSIDETLFLINLQSSYLIRPYIVLDCKSLIINIINVYKGFRDYFKNQKISLPELGDYAVGMVFLPNDITRSSIAQKAVEQAISDEGQIFIGWRDVPTDDTVLGDSVINNKPIIKQFFIQRSSKCIDENHFQRKLYVIRKTVHKKIHQSNLLEWEDFYIVSLSTRTIVFKGMVLAPNLSKFYVDFQDTKFETAIALFHLSLIHI